jgi:ubiquinone/menaquinone biosynthesis C-methylase UbiE
MNVEPFEQYTDDYEEWFERHAFVYKAELQAVRLLLPTSGIGMEIGLGTGRFAAPVGIKIGIEPAQAMRKVAQERGLEVIDGVAEALPLKNEQFDFALMVTTLCFIDDIQLAFQEAWRILKPGGYFINGFVDRTSFLGQIYQRYKNQNVFYKVAHFYSVSEVLSFLEKTRFQHFTFTQTVFRGLDDITGPEPVKQGYGEGAFVVVRGIKSLEKKI